MLRAHRAPTICLPDLPALMLTDFLKTFSTPPVLLGHSMGAVLAQQLATAGFAQRWF
jgi:pimeloyl-ACP methyl ester carboxylesterase